MTISRELAQQALKVLEHWDARGRLRIIEALRQALEQKQEQQKQEPLSMANGKIKVTLQETPAEIELKQYKRMFEAACSDLGAINNALGLDHEDGGAESILFAIEELKGHPKEPIAWMVYSLDGMSVCVTDNPTDFTPKHKALPLYTTPPKREWVGLTEEDEEHCENEAAVKYRRYKSSIRGQLITPADCYEWHLIRAVEAKLREKNT